MSLIHNPRRNKAMDNTTYILMGGISGVFLFITLYNMFKGRLFWIADLGLDLLLTLLAPMILNGNALMALALGVSFTMTLRIAHMFMPGEYLKFVIEKGWPKLRWIIVPPKKFELPQRRRF